MGVKVHTGMLFKDGGYSDERKWVSLEDYETLKRNQYWRCRICGGIVNFSDVVAPDFHIGPGGGKKHAQRATDPTDEPR